MIDFTKQCVFKFLSDRQSGRRDRDVWKFDGQQDMWTEFLKHHTQLTTDNNAAFCHEHVDELEVSQLIVNLKSKNNY